MSGYGNTPDVVSNLPMTGADTLGIIIVAVFIILLGLLMRAYPRRTDG
jgi:LPXTG-motif cell wall-anchored protein